jgi:hypothetical protein
VYGISLRLQYASGIDPETPTHTIVSRNINSHQGLGANGDSDYTAASTIALTAARISSDNCGQAANNASKCASVAVVGAALAISPSVSCAESPLV